MMIHYYREISQTVKARSNATLTISVVMYSEKFRLLVSTVEIKVSKVDSQFLINYSPLCNSGVIIDMIVSCCQFTIE